MTQISELLQENWDFLRYGQACSMEGQGGGERSASLEPCRYFPMRSFSFCPRAAEVLTVGAKTEAK